MGGGREGRGGPRFLAWLWPAPLNYPFLWTNPCLSGLFLPAEMNGCGFLSNRSHLPLTVTTNGLDGGMAGKGLTQVLSLVDMGRASLSIFVGSEVQSSCYCRCGHRPSPIILGSAVALNSWRLPPQTSQAEAAAYKNLRQLPVWFLERICYLWNHWTQGQGLL